jgi:serine protease Do
MGRFLTSTVAAVILASSSAVCADGLPSGTGTKLPPDAQAAIDHAKSLSKAFRAISKLAGPSVVSVEVTPDVHRMMGGMRMAPGMQLPPGFQMFQMGPGGMQPMQQPMQQVPKEMGTGFIVAEEGYVVTNNHVVKDGVGGTVMVHLNDGREAPAQVVGTDPETDIAVLRIDMPNLKAIEFADSDQADVGDWVIALGAPFGLKDSVTAGIISAKGREVGLSPLESYLQTDATINPGNSGGPLVDMDGHVVGINTAIESRSGGSDGIGFAIPANMAKGVVESIIAGNAPSRGFLGIQMQPLDRQLAANFGFDGGGVLVNQVVPGGAAERAGVKVGDILVKVNGEAVPSLQRVQRAVKLCKPGSECPIEVFRDGGTVTLAAQLDDSSKQVAAATAPAPAIRLAPDAVQQHAAKQREPASLGIEVAAITPAMAKERGMADTHGVAVTKVADGGAAARAGLKEGDIIRQVGGNTVSDPSEWDAAVRKVTAHGRSVRLLVERDGASKFLLLRS